MRFAVALLSLSLFVADVSFAQPPGVRGANQGRAVGRRRGRLVADTMLTAHAAAGLEAPQYIAFNATTASSLVKRPMGPEEEVHIANTSFTGTWVIHTDSNNSAGTGVLRYTNSTTTMSWEDPGGSEGSGVNVGGGGHFTLTGGGGGKIEVFTRTDQLPGTDQSVNLTIAAGAGFANWSRFNYDWDFGDASLGNATNGSKKSDGSARAIRGIGEICGVVYENPGTYTVTLTLDDDVGGQYVYTQKLTLSSRTYTDDIYISWTDGNDANGGTGIGDEVQTWSRADDLLTNTYGGTDVWVRPKRGDTWPAAAGSLLSLGSTDHVRVSPYGTGANPIVQFNTNQAFGCNLATDILLEDLEIRGPAVTGVSCIVASRTVDMLVSKCDLRLSGDGITMQGNPDRATRFCFWKGSVDQCGYDQGDVAIYGLMEDSAIIDCSFGDIVTLEHNIRTQSMSNIYVAYNSIGNPGATKTALAHRGSAAETWNSHYIVAYNRIDTEELPTDNLGVIAISIANWPSDVHIRHILIEGNYCTRLDYKAESTTLIVNGHAMGCIRNNVCVLGVSHPSGQYQGGVKGLSVSTSISAVGVTIEANRYRNEIYNNTFYATGVNAVGGKSFSLLEINALGGAESRACIARNNVGYNGDWTGPFKEWDDNSENNGVTSNNIYDGTDPLFTNPAGEDFSLQSGSSARGAGIAVPVIFDYDEVRRTTSPPDIGAVEF